MENNQALRKNLALRVDYTEDESKTALPPSGEDSNSPAGEGIDLKAIREAIGRVEAEAKATVAAENRARSEARARALAEERARIDAAASAEAYQSAKAEEEAIAASKEALSALKRLGDEIGTLHVSESLLRAQVVAGDLAAAIKLGDAIHNTTEPQQIPGLG